MTTRLDTELVRRGLARSRGHAGELIASGRVAVDGGRSRAVPSRSPTSGRSTVAARRRRSRVRVPRRAQAGGRARRARRGRSGRRRAALPRRGGEHRRVHRRAAAPGCRARRRRRRRATTRWSTPCARDPRVDVREGVNVRSLARGDVDPAPTLVVADLSFISLTLVLPALVGRGDARRRPAPDGQAAVRGRPRAARVRRGRPRCRRCGSTRSSASRGRPPGWASACADVVRSPLPGPSGNVEFFVWLRRGRRRRRRVEVPSSASRAAVLGEGDAMTPAGTAWSRTAAARRPCRPPGTSSRELERAGVEPVLAAEDAVAGDLPSFELAIVLGGDGTILRAAELTRGHGRAAARREPRARRLPRRERARRRRRGRAPPDGGRVRRRGARHARRARAAGRTASVGTGWALNEAALEKVDRSRMLEVARRGRRPPAVVVRLRRHRRGDGRPGRPRTRSRRAGRSSGPTSTA